ncbi:T9SS type A sorting domain-containing protein [candidate division KSB1 bacterium]|nr:T9SS type A sorting domain-containing protein [candidate division KSB1 bacterium]
MKYVRLIGLLLLITMGTLLAQSRILMLGNSITAGVGSTSGTGFRQMLYDQLESYNYDFEFVGPSGSEDHLKGYFIPGVQIGQFYYGPGGTAQFNVSNVLNAYRPNIVMIHLGTNDLYTDDSIGPYSVDSGTTFEDTTICGRLAYLCAKILEWHNGIQDTCVQMLFVSAIVPRLGEERRCLGFYNTVYYNIDSDSRMGRIPSISPNTFRTIDQFNSFDISTMISPDSIHPNDTGYENMANVYGNYWRNFPLQYFSLSNLEYTGKKTGDQIQIGVRILKGTGAAFNGMEVRFKVEEGPVTFTTPSQFEYTTAEGIAEKTILVTGEGVARITATVKSTINKSITFTVWSQDHVFVQGEVAYVAENQAVPNTVIEWVEGAESVDTTDASGLFGASRIPLNEDFTIRPWKEQWSDVTPSSILSYDASLVARHSVGLEILSSNAQQAGDVNTDGFVDMMDALYIGRYAVGMTSPGSVHIGEWTFSPETQAHGAAIDTVTFPVFTAMLTGDVKGGWQSSAPKINPGLWEITPVPEQYGDTLSVQLLITEADWLSTDFSYHYDPTSLKFLSIDKSAGLDGFQLLHKSSISGEGRVALFGINPARGNMVDLRFLVLNPDEPAQILFDPLYIETTRMNPTQVVVNPESSAHPVQLVLHPNYPNPFNASTVLSYSLEKSGKVRLDVQNTLGQQVACLIEGHLEAGSHSIHWNGTDDHGQAVPSGVYILTLQTQAQRLVRKINLIR